MYKSKYRAMSDEYIAQEEARLGAAGWPPHLVKATYDPFVYALRLRTGEVIVFESAEPVCGDQWAYLKEPVFTESVNGRRSDEKKSSAFNFERGVEVRVADIVWVSDAPWGS